MSSMHDSVKLRKEKLSLDNLFCVSVDGVLDMVEWAGHWTRYMVELDKIHG